MKKLLILSALFIVAGIAIYNGIRESEDRVSTVITSNENSEYSGDLFLLASLIEAEASGKSYTEQVAVGAVALNRLKSSIFPDTLPSVVYQQNAFRSVMNGTISLPHQDSINAAKDALSGWDPTYGALEITE